MTPSIARAVARALNRGIASVAAAIVAVSAITTTAVVVRRDDAQARAQALALGAELWNHRDDPPELQREKVQHELHEHSAFGRTIEVWRGGALLGTEPRQLQAWDHTDACTLATLGGVLTRICAVAEAQETTIVVASPVWPLLEAQLPMVGAIALSALCAVMVFSVIVRRIATRSLAPLNAFDATIASLPALSAGRRLPRDWGAAEVDQLAVTFNALLERIDFAVAREQRFVANAAHELRTPVTRLRGQLELTLEDATLTDEARRRLERAVRSCVELGRSLESLLALARPDLLTLQTVDLGELITDLIAQLSAEERTRITAVAAPALVRGEELLLGFALRNLIENALRYTEGRVEVRTAASDDACVVSVRDHGAGLSAEELARVREPFVRGALHARNIRGSGLGLALVEHVATQHRGTLTLENARDAAPGLIASLRLPPWQPEQEPR